MNTIKILALTLLVVIGCSTPTPPAPAPSAEAAASTSSAAASRIPRGLRRGPATSSPSIPSPDLRTPQQNRPGRVRRQHMQGDSGQADARCDDVVPHPSRELDGARVVHRLGQLHDVCVGQQLGYGRDVFRWVLGLGMSLRDRTAHHRLRRSRDTAGTRTSPRCRKRRQSTSYRHRRRDKRTLSYAPRWLAARTSSSTAP